MKENKYTKEGFLIVSESHTCSLWEKDERPCRSGWTCACFFCKFTDFRTEESIRKTEQLPCGTILYSICYNEKNKKSNLDVTY